MWSTDTREIDGDLSLGQLIVRLTEMAVSDRIHFPNETSMGVPQLAERGGIVDLTDRCPFETRDEEFWCWLQDQDEHGPDQQPIAVHLKDDNIWVVESWVHF